MRVLGIDLAWRDGDAARPANETGVVAVDEEGRVLNAGWTRGVAETAAWASHWSGDHCLAMVDASLVVPNATGQRESEKLVARCYGRWKVACNATNQASPHQAGAALLARLGWRYHSGFDGPPRRGRWLAETFPYTTLVGAIELGYDTVRPVYKRKPRTMPVAEFRPRRAVVCDEMIRRVAALRGADPPVDIASHPVTAALGASPSPLNDREYKHREDLLDAVLCAWAGLLWLRHGLARSQVLGDPTAAVICPARPEQRLPPP